MKRIRRTSASAGLAALCYALLGAALAHAQAPESRRGETPPLSDAPAHARAELQPTHGNDVSGTVEFTETAEGLVVRAELRGLDQGPHGLHIHEIGDCSAPDASSAGGHMTPANDPHGAPDDPAPQHHAGDLGNLTADSGGRATSTLTDPELTLTEGRYHVVGRAVVVHSGRDDLESQPSGDSGDRVACGVVRLLTQTAPAAENG